MYKKRVGVFETNSSSIHSICIQRKPVENIRGKRVFFGFGEYGWEDGCADPASYLRTAMYGLGMEDQFNMMIEKLVDEYGIDCVLSDDTGDIWYPHGYVDHCYELKELIDCLLNDDDLLIRFILGGDSAVYTGNDNDDFDTASEPEETHEVYWKGN